MARGVDLVLMWHKHQPDDRLAADGGSVSTCSSHTTMLRACPQHAGFDGPRRKSPALSGGLDSLAAGGWVYGTPSAWISDPGQGRSMRRAH